MKFYTKKLDLFQQLGFLIICSMMSFSVRAACDFTLAEPVTVTQQTPFNVDGMQYYYLFDCDGNLIVSENTTTNFGIQPYGCYEIYAVNSCSGVAPAGVASPADITALSSTDYANTSTPQFTVCDVSRLGTDAPICEEEPDGVLVVTEPQSYEMSNDMTYVLVCSIDGSAHTISGAPVTIPAGATPAQATFTIPADNDATANGGPYVPDCRVYVLNYCSTADLSALVDGADWATVDPGNSEDVASGSVPIVVQNCVGADEGDECNADAGTNGALDIYNDEQSVNLFSILGGTPDPGGIWNDTSGSGIDISDPTNVDFTAVATGSYTFTYTVYDWNGACPDQSSQVVINVTSLGTIPYCVPDYYYYEPLSNYIYGVGLGCIQNIGTGNMYGPPYTDYTDMSTILEAGHSTTITLYSSSSGNETNVSNTWAEAWIDYDDNGIFSNNESLLQYHFTNDVASVSLPIFIPDNGTYGERRLRVRYTQGSLAGPCGQNSCGEAEDYTVVIIEGGIESPGNACQNEQVLFRSDLDMDGVTYQWLAEGNPNIHLESQTNGWIIYEWAEPGSYNVTLQIFSAGCMTTYHQQIVINEVEVAIIGESEVCNGSTMELSAISSQNGSYVWDGEGITDNNTESIIINTETLTPDTYTYCVTLTSDGGCTNTICKNVEILAKPTIAIIGPSAICHGDSLELLAVSAEGGTYSWFGEGITDNGQSAMINTANLTPGFYSYTTALLGGNGCSDTTVTVIEVFGNPTAEICEPTTILLTCIDTSIILNATCSTANGNDMEYSWSGPDGELGTDSSQSVTQAGLYIVVITDVQNGCRRSDSIEIMEALPPEVEIYHNGGHCEGDITSLFAFAGFGGSYMWSGEGVTAGNSNDNPIYLSVLPIGTHTYDVIYTDEYGCTATDSKDILIIEAPDAGIGGGSLDICSSGDTVGNLMAEIGGTPDPGIWEDTDNSGVDLSDPANVDFSGIMAGSYTFTFIVEGAYSCKDASSEIEVNVFSVDAGTDGSTEICNSGYTELNLPQQLGGTPDAGGTWTDTGNSGVNLSDPTSVDFTGVPLGSYTFTYTLQGIFPCVDASSAVVVNVLSATVEITASPNTVCEGESLELLAENPNGTAGNYQWTGNGVTVDNSGNNPLLLTDLPVGTHTYTITYTNQYGCMTTDSETITVIQAPNAGTDTTIDICRGDSIVIYLYDLLQGIPDLGGKWTDANNSGVDLSDYTNVDFTNIPDGSYTFIYTVEGIAPCADASSEHVINISSVDAGENGTTDVCNNGDTVNLPSVLGGTPDANGIWTDTDNSGVDLDNPANVDFSGVPVGNYTFIYTAIGTYPCTNDTSQVIVNVTGIATDFCYETNGNTVTITNNSTASAALSYLWDFGDGTTSAEEHPVHTYSGGSPSGTYEVCLTVTFADGTTCHYTCCKEITIYPPCKNDIPGPKFNYVFKNSGYIQFENPLNTGSAFTKEWTIDGVFHSDKNQAPAKKLNPGIHKVCLTVTRNSKPNCSETFCRDILVNDPCKVPLEVKFAYETCLDSKTFIFESIAIGAETGVTTHWDFGNGDTATGNTTQYTYPDYGSYMLCMNVTNSENCSKQTCGIIEVLEPFCMDNTPLSSTGVAKVTSNNKIPGNELVDKINGGTEFQIIPNPASNRVKAVFSKIKSDKATITLSGTSGKTITRTSVKKGSRTHEFNISDLPAGIYIMTLQRSDGKKISSKIVKI